MALTLPLARSTARTCVVELRAGLATRSSIGFDKTRDPAVAGEGGTAGAGLNGAYKIEPQNVIRLNIVGPFERSNSLLEVRGRGD